LYTFEDYHDALITVCMPLFRATVLLKRLTQNTNQKITYTFQHRKQYNYKSFF